MEEITKVRKVKIDIGKENKRYFGFLMYKADIAQKLGYVSAIATAFSFAVRSNLFIFEFSVYAFGAISIGAFCLSAYLKKKAKTFMEKLITHIFDDEPDRVEDIDDEEFRQ